MNHLHDNHAINVVVVSQPSSKMDMMREGYAVVRREVRIGFDVRRSVKFRSEIIPDMPVISVSPVSISILQPRPAAHQGSIRTEKRHKQSCLLAV